MVVPWLYAAVDLRTWYPWCIDTEVMNKLLKQVQALCFFFVWDEFCVFKPKKKREKGTTPVLAPWTRLPGFIIIFCLNYRTITLFIPSHFLFIGPFGFVWACGWGLWTEDFDMIQSHIYKWKVTEHFVLQST